MRHEIWGKMESGKGASTVGGMRDVEGRSGSTMGGPVGPEGGFSSDIVNGRDRDVWKYQMLQDLGR